MVMPLMGFEELPMRPTMREETVTNKNPKTTTKIPAIRFANRPVCAPGIGRNVKSAHIMATITSEPKTTTLMGRSRLTRSAAAAPAARWACKSLSPARSADQIVGIVLASVIKPAAATAPAPMGRM